MRRRWVRIVGDGLVYEGPCLVHSVVMVSDSTKEYAIIYDGRDATSGKQFTKVLVFAETTYQVDFAEGVPFDQGIYVDAKNSPVQTTVVFTPLEC